MENIEKLRGQLMEKIDQDNLMEVEKVNRYIEHIESYRRMEKIIKKEGESVTTINATQEFVKAHPLLNEKNKVNASIINIEKSFNFTNAEEEEIQRTKNDLL